MVAPLAGAWIEMAANISIIRWQNWSLPSRERGLKSHWRINALIAIRSLPSRERGLK